jgi:hypothetical protein
MHARNFALFQFVPYYFSALLVTSNNNNIDILNFVAINQIQ